MSGEGRAKVVAVAPPPPPPRYEEQMFYFNAMTRVAQYRHDVVGVPGLDYCYDCNAEVVILKQYLASAGVAEEHLLEEVAAMSLWWLG